MSSRRKHKGFGAPTPEVPARVTTVDHMVTDLAASLPEGGVLSLGIPLAGGCRSTLDWKLGGLIWRYHCCLSADHPTKHQCYFAGVLLCSWHRPDPDEADEHRGGGFGGQRCDLVIYDEIDS
jgi:hypothetical protein